MNAVNKQIKIFNIISNLNELLHSDFRFQIIDGEFTGSFDLGPGAEDLSGNAPGFTASNFSTKAWRDLVTTGIIYLGGSAATPVGDLVLATEQPPASRFQSVNSYGMSSLERSISEEVGIVTSDPFEGNSVEFTSLTSENARSILDGSYFKVY